MIVKNLEATLPLVKARYNLPEILLLGVGNHREDKYIKIHNKIIGEKLKTMLPTELGKPYNYGRNEGIIINIGVSNKILEQQQDFLLNFYLKEIALPKPSDKKESTDYVILKFDSTNFSGRFDLIQRGSLKELFAQVGALISENNNTFYIQNIEYKSLI